MFFSLSFLFSLLFITNNLASSHETSEETNSHHKRHIGLDQGFHHFSTTQGPQDNDGDDVNCELSPCVGDCNPCLFDGVCEESCKHEGGYKCTSPTGRLGKNTTYSPPAINCNGNSIEVQIITPFFNQPEYEYKTFYISQRLDGIKCAIGRDIAIGNSGIPGLWSRFTVDTDRYASCLTKVVDVENKKLSYETILWSDTQGTNYDMPKPIIQFQCHYKTEYYINTNIQPLVSTPGFLERNGETLSLEIELCKQSMCDGYCPPKMQVGPQATYTVNERVYVGIKSFNPSSAVFRGQIMTIKSVYLSCSPSVGSNINLVEIFEYGCLNPAVENMFPRPGALQVHRACFSFRTVRLNACRNQFYIHAHVSLCDSATATCTDGSRTCQANLENPLGRRRRSVDEDKVETMVLGPLHVGEEETTATGSFLPLELSSEGDTNDGDLMITERTVRLGREEPDEATIVFEKPSHPLFIDEANIDPIPSGSDDGESYIMMSDDVPNWHTFLTVGLFLVLISVLLLSLLFFQFYSRYIVGAQMNGLKS